MKIFKALIIVILIIAIIYLLYPQVEEEIVIRRDNSPVKGDADTKIFIFVDYSSEDTRDFFRNKFQKIVNEFVQTGIVSLYVKDYALSESSQRAAEATRCFREQKGDEGYFNYVDVLLENQYNFTTENFIIIAEGLNINKFQFESCLDARRMMSFLERDYMDARGLGITATPYLFINGQIINGMESYESIRMKILNRKA